MPKHTGFCRLVNSGVTFGLAIAMAGMLAGCGSGGGDANETPRPSTSATRDRGVPIEPAARTATAAAAAITPGANGGMTPEPGEGGETPLLGTVDPEFLPPSATPLPPSGLRIELTAPQAVTTGSTVEARVRILGDADQRIGAFNFDLVYDQRQIVLEAPQPNQPLFDSTGRDFNCDLPPPSGDIEGAPDVGRARLVCFSFGGASEPGFAPDATLATIRLRPLVPGDIELRWERVAFYAVDGTNLGLIDRPPARVSAE